MRIHTIPLVTSIVFLAGCREAPQRTEAKSGAAPAPVQTALVATADWPTVYEATGTVRARTTAVISSKVMGYVREVKVRVGDRVRPGQLLVLLDARDLDANYRQAEAARNEASSALPEAENAVAAAKASLELAQVTFGRMQDLFQKKSISNQEFDESSAKLKLARAQYEMAVSKRAQLASRIRQAEEAFAAAQVTRDYSKISAPFAGIVTEKPVEPGNLATPGTPLLTLEQEGAYRLEVSIEESRLPLIRVGLSASVTLDALDRTIDARVSEVVPTVDAAARAFVAKIDLPLVPQLCSGLFGRARFALGRRRVLAVPAAAVRESGQLQSVLVVEEGQARSRLITSGERSPEGVEVLSGLNAGERVISPIPAGLADGARVEVRP